MMETARSGNPVVIRAFRRDTVEVPSGRYPTGVVRPNNELRVPAP